MTLNAETTTGLVRAVAQRRFCLFDYSACLNLAGKLIVLRTLKSLEAILNQRILNRIALWSLRKLKVS